MKKVKRDIKCRKIKIKHESLKYGRMEYDLGYKTYILNI